MNMIRKEHWMIAGALLLLLALLAAAVVNDLRTPLWTDELLTLYVSEQPTAGDILASIREGVDSQPPTYDLLVRWLHPLVSNDELRVRLPSTIGFFAMCVGVFWFARKRLPLIYAIMAALIAARTTWIYAFEGRSYGAVLGAVTLALIFWQRAATSRRFNALVGLSLSLAIAISLHYAAVCVLAAFLVGEAARWWKSRKLDWPMLVALTVPALILIPHLPLIRAGKPFVKYFWSKANAATLYAVYLRFWLPLLLSLVLAAACTLLLMAVRSRKKERLRQPGSGMPVHEWLVVITLVLLPEFVVLASLLTVEAFVDRYVLWTMIGGGLLLAALLSRATGGNVPVATVVMLPLVIWTFTTVTAAATDSRALRHGENLRNELASVPPEPGPIVVAGIHSFMELWFYSTPALRDRLVFLTNPDLEVRYLHTDTTSRLLSALRKRKAAAGGTDYDQFIAANPSFIVADDSGEWTVTHLRQMHYELLPLEGRPKQALFLARRPGTH